MTSARIIHITSELPPAIGGVADYTTILSRRLIEVSEGNVELVLIHAGKAPIDTIDVDVPVVNRSAEQSATVLANSVRRLVAETGGRAVVLLEYSGYGYAKRGTPLWLVRGLNRVCGREGVPLVTMFHELYATGPPWRSSFWLSPVQRYVVTRLAGMSQGVLTNRPASFDWLRGLKSGEDGPVIFNPVCSNVGEPSRWPPFEARSSYAVVFGGAGRKSRIYRENRTTVKEVLSTHDVESITDIGPTDDEARLSAEALPVHFEGILEEEEVSEQLRQAKLGLVSYPASRLAKSGAFAAFLSHGVPVVVFDEQKDDHPPHPYRPGQHYIDGGLGASASVDLQAVSRAAFQQYREWGHSKVNADRILQLVSRIV